jgi:pyruvate/2-oxoglutarate dehydrogenase complex dihydrolipoamide acyltransferase (E2) component
VPETATVQPTPAPAVNNQISESQPFKDNLTAKFGQIGGSTTGNSETNWEIGRNLDDISSTDSMEKVQIAELGAGAPLIWSAVTGSGDSGPSVTFDDDSAEAAAAAKAAAAKAAAAKAAAAKAAAAKAAAAKAAAAKAAAAKGAGASGGGNGGRHDSDSHR